MKSNLQGRSPVGARYLAFIGGNAAGLRALIAGVAGAALLACSPPTDASAPREGRPNVVLIVPDTMRADALGVYGASPGASPNIDQLARHALVADNAVSIAPWTPPSMASLFTGVYQSVHGVTHSASDDSQFKTLSREFVSLAEVFRAAGYRTGAVSSQGWVSPRLGFAQGFEDFEIISSIVDPFATERVTVGGLDWLARHREEPFFLFLNYLDPHDPYEPPPPFDSMAWRGPTPTRIADLANKGWRAKSEFLMNGDDPGPRHVTKDELEYLRAMYQGEVRYVDWWIGVVVRQLEKWELSDRTIIAIISDHGESFLEHGQLHHIWHVYNENLKVPFIISSPSRFDEPVHVRHLVQSIDLYPTLLGLADLEAPQGIQGHDILSDRSPTGVAYSEGYENRQIKVQTDEWSAIVTLDAHGRARGTELYALRADPLEQVDLAASNPAKASELRLLALACYEASLRSPLRRGPELVEVDSETRAQLRALGYIN